VKSYLLSLALIIAAPAAIAQSVSPLTETNGRHCTADGAWCVVPFDGGFVADNRGVLKPLPIEAFSDNEELAVWPHAIVRNGSVLLGVTRRISSMYSGGGASSYSLSLFEVGNGAAPAQLVLEDGPWRGDVMIRACFGERDMRTRRGACHDEYRFSATYAPGPNGTLTYASVAESYPAGVRRMEDNTQRRVTRRDLRWERDDACSVTRTLTRDANGVFQFDAPLPECTDYTVP